MTRTLFLAGCAITAIATTLFAAPAAHAQLGILGAGPAPGTQGGISSGKSADDYYKKPPLAPGLPGARSTPDRAAPADRPATDMEPNDALFDAVNRGDIAAVREALGRGADIRAHNILGMTPTDLSVDLGHADITFLLLSMRNAAPAPGARRAGAAAPAKPAAAGGVRVATAPLTAVQADTPGSAPVARVAPAPARAPVVARVAPTPRPVPHPVAPRVMADDGGTPRPSVGFLGFGK